MASPPPGNRAPYAVLSRYRVWGGAGDPLQDALDELERLSRDAPDIAEEELLRQLMEDADADADA